MNKLLIFLIEFMFGGVLAYPTDFITIGQCGNAANSHGYGAVGYRYNISIYEITNSQYCTFLNCVAEKEDPYELFSPLMQQHYLGGISRDYSNDKYRYICKAGYENKPVIGVTWMSAIRYINWLHYNSFHIENNDPINSWLKYTEGDENCGAYNTLIVPEHRNPNALYWLPNRSEWEKAAYYKSGKWLEKVPSPLANCYDEEYGWKMPYPHIADVGLCIGPNGTYDQQGNAAEWVENSKGNWKQALGGSLIRPKYFSYCGEIEADDPHKSISTFGFRICQTTDSTLRRVQQSYNIRLDTIKQNVTNSERTAFLRVGDVKNKGDIVNQYKGEVLYEYYIARTELTNKEYCDFLNAVAVEDDRFSLYNHNMADGVCGGIIRAGMKGEYSYKCRPGWENKPVVYISYYDLARYANWMHYGCPVTGKSILGTTEGNEKQGAYNTTDFELVRYGEKKVYKSFGMRNRGALYWIPNEDEWYKAAYYDPTLIGNRKYHDYPTRTSNPPSHKQANYVIQDRLNIGEPFFVANVDSFSDSPSYYGTLQQGGNVWEWLESWQYGNVGVRGLRGGSWSYTEFGLNACNTDPGGINDRSYVFGGRLCMASDKTNGWQPIHKPLTQTIHEHILLLSEKQACAFILYTLVVSLFAFFCVTHFIGKKCKQKLKR